MSVIILSVLVMSLLLGISRSVAKKMTFSADFFFGEKAYFAAESGVEKALILLKDAPAKHGEIPITFSTDPTEIELSIHNNSQEFLFSLAPFASRKLRLQVNTKGETYAPANLSKISISASPENGNPLPEMFLWSIQCRTEDNTTVSIQSSASEVQSGEIFNWNGNYDDKDGKTRPQFPVSQFWEDELASEDEQKSCFLSFQNLTDTPLSVNIKSHGIPPERAIITATGKAQNRQKKIEFEYLQNNLSSFFNFGLLHTEKE